MEKELVNSAMYAVIPKLYVKRYAQKWPPIPRRKAKQKESPLPSRERVGILRGLRCNPFSSRHFIDVETTEKSTCWKSLGFEKFI
jgi:hypothetical protein